MEQHQWTKETKIKNVQLSLKISATIKAGNFRKRAEKKVELSDREGRGKRIFTAGRVKWEEKNY